MSNFQGLWVPLVTPFRDGAVDLSAALRLAEHLLAHGVQGLVVCGTTGEAATLSDEEQERLLLALLERVGARCPVVMGIGGADTAHVAALARRFGELPVAGLLVGAPYYLRPSQDGIRRHFEAVAAATTRPIVIYNIPYRCGVNIELATLQALCVNPQFRAIKESGGGSLAQTLEMLAATPLQVLCGEDALIFPTACLGGSGAIAAAAHLRPDLFRRMLDHVGRGELAPARALQRRLQPLVQALFVEPNPGPLKAVLSAQGLIGEELRLPMTAASAACRARLLALLAALDRELPA